MEGALPEFYLLSVVSTMYIVDHEIKPFKFRTRHFTPTVAIRVSQLNNMKL